MPTARLAQEKGPRRGEALLFMAVAGLLPTHRALAAWLRVLGRHWTVAVRVHDHREQRAVKPRPRVFCRSVLKASQEAQTDPAENLPAFLTDGSANLKMSWSTSPGCENR